MGFLSGHRGRGGEELGRATIDYYVDVGDELSACTFSWHGSSDLLELLPMLMADEHIHYLRKHPDGLGGYLLLERAKEAGLDEVKSRVKEAREYWNRESRVLELTAPPVVRRTSGAIAGTAEILIVLERRANRLFTDSKYTPKMNRPVLYTVTPLVAWNHVLSRIRENSAAVERFFNNFAALLRYYESSRLKLDRTRDIGKAPFELWASDLKAAVRL